MRKPLSILILTDGKPGHQNQSIGLAEAIGRLTPAEIRRRSVAGSSLASWFSRPAREQEPPDLVIGSGHATHLPLIKLARSSGACCVVVMKPSLPAALFDLCLVPRHDFGDRTPPPNVVTTIGAINRVPPPSGQDRRGGLILLGGPSSTHGWDADGIQRQVGTIVGSCGNRPWRITDSRRSPAGTLDAATAACPALVAYPHADTGPEWLPLRLTEAAEVWVSEDSVSMIYESLSSGAPTGLLRVPRKRRRSRVTRGIDTLVAEGWITPFEAWTPGQPLAPPPRVLREADRCAGIVLENLFPGHHPCP